MKTVLMGIVFSIALIFGTRAFASDTLPYCTYTIWTSALISTPTGRRRLVLQLEQVPCLPQ